MYDFMCRLLEKPPLYARTEEAFWDDAYISMQMLKAHLNPEFEGASRKLSFIESSVAWIKELAGPKAYPALLDIGCGPGLYAERFSKAGYTVTGVDFSKRSIEYAQTSALRQGLDITYLYQDYLIMDMKKEFDFATLIYCDYGALSTADRQIVMNRVYRHLRPGGKFLLDVFSMAQYLAFEVKQTWSICHDGGFWREGDYIELNGSYRYTDNVTLEQTCIISGYNVSAYYLWNTYFTPEMLAREAADAGFKICAVFGDVAGAPYREDSTSIAILLEK